MKNTGSIYLINLLIPNVGDRITFAQYKKKLTNMGYNIYAQLGSIGGSKTAGIIRYEGDEIVRQ